ncbi:NHR-66 protein [Aphelenchoides avenae]|nr:NHR-66 protein [Aphelenchus avenae]
MDSSLISAAQAAEQLACNSVVSALMNSVQHNFLSTNALQKGPATPATPLLFEEPASIKSVNSVGSAGSCMSASSGAVSNETDPMSPSMGHNHIGYIPVPSASHSSTSQRLISSSSLSPPSYTNHNNDTTSGAGLLQPSTSHHDSFSRALPQVPKCSICGADSTGIHFGVEACAACSAFFRRTVVLNKNYVCTRDGNCNFHKDSPTGQKCRACRFNKCLDVGMDKNAVQHRRDAIGKYSTVVKRECESPADCFPGPSTSIRDSISPPPVKISRVAQSVLDEVKERYDELNRRRKVFYCKASLKDLFDDEVELEPAELTNFGDCMFQLWRVEPRLCVEFISGNRFLHQLASTEKACLKCCILDSLLFQTKIFSNFMLTFQAIEEPYVTWKFGGLERRFWMMPNRTFVDFSKAESYFDSTKGIMKDLNLDKTSAIKIFKPSFEHAMGVVGEKMAAMNITKTEMIALVGIVLLDPTNQSLEPTTQELLHNLRSQLFKDVMRYYEADAIDNPEVRLGNLILLMSGVKIHAQVSRVNMQMLKIFDVVPRDELFDEVVGISTPSSADP